MAKGVLEGLASGFFGGFERTFTPALKRGWADAKAAERRGEEIAWRENRWQKEFGLKESEAKATADWRTQQAETAAERARLTAKHRADTLEQSEKESRRRAATARYAADARAKRAGSSFDVGPRIDLKSFESQARIISGSDDLDWPSKTALTALAREFKLNKKVSSTTVQRAVKALKDNYPNMGGSDIMEQFIGPFGINRSNTFVPPAQSAPSGPSGQRGWIYLSLIHI